MTLRVYVSDATTLAPDATPHELDLGTLFDGLPSAGG